MRTKTRSEPSVPINSSRTEQWVSKYVIVDDERVGYTLTMFVHGGYGTCTTTGTTNVEVRFLETIRDIRGYVTNGYFSEATNRGVVRHPDRTSLIYADVPYDAVERFILEHAL